MRGVGHTMTIGEAQINTAGVIVIGDGVVDASALHHLTKLGWIDVAILERSELTSWQRGMHIREYLSKWDEVHGRS